MEPVSFSVPASSPIRSFAINKFKGVDFSNNPTQVDPERSPDAMNMISDLAGFPVKRSGTKIIHDFKATIYGIYKIIVDKEEKKIVHAGNKLFIWGENFQVIYSDMNLSRSMAFEMNKKLWIQDGKRMLCYGKFKDGEVESWELKNVEDIAKIPTTVIARAPTGGGTTYEGINLLQPKRTNSFLSIANATSFQLDTSELDSAAVTAKVLQSDGSYKDWIEGTNFTVDRKTGIVKTTTSPGVSPVTGHDNFEVTFAKTPKGYADRINHCTIYTIYGVGATDNRVFVSGNEELRNFDWYSGINDPSYFSDLSYSQIGQNSSAIMGYRKIGEYLSIHKQDNQQDSTVFLRTGHLSDDNTPVFAVKQGIIGTGAVSKYCFSNLRDDPLFLSSQGVNAVSTNAITAEKYAQDRSYYINERLRHEPNLEEACAVSVDGFYYLSVNGHVYVADSRQKSYNSKSNSDSFQYEWYYWEGVDAYTWFVDDKLYFGTKSGKLKCFSDETDLHRYLDESEPVKAYWITPMLTMDTILNYKVIKQFVVMMNPYNRSSVEIFYRIKSLDKFVKREYIDIFDFSDIDFTRFAFSTDYGPQIIATNRKAKNFMMIQFLLQNKNEEPFGFYQLSTSYKIKGKYKGRI